ncbi:hypothetical protein Hanom_Chr13g01190821 [Helianthus anomalus]
MVVIVVWVIWLGVKVRAMVAIGTSTIVGVGFVVVVVMTTDVVVMTKTVVEAVAKLDNEDGGGGGGGGKTYIPKNFYTKTTYISLLSEKFGGSGAPRPLLSCAPGWK